MKILSFTIFMGILTALIPASAYAQASKGNESQEQAEANKNTSKVEVGVDFDQQDPFVNEIYQKGNYLVYDCLGKYWVCTGETEFKACKRERVQAIDESEKNIKCAHFAEFGSREECYKEQQRITHHGVINRFCQHPFERQRTKDF